MSMTVSEAMEWLKRNSTKATRDGMARYGLPSDRAFGVPMNKIQELAKELPRDHRLAAELWSTGVYEARLLAALVDEVDKVTPGQMDRWCRDFDNWGVCDTVCFKLFDQTPHAFKKVQQWHDRKEEFVKRGAFALLACLALHNESADNEAFMRCLPLIEKAAIDDRNFVKKSVSWALRSIGRRNAELKKAVVALAKKLANSPEPAAKWHSKDVISDLKKPAPKGK